MNIVNNLSTEPSSIHCKATTGVIRYNTGKVSGENLVDYQPPSPLFTHCSSSMFLKCTPFLWPHHPLSQFYSFWSYYWSFFGRKCSESMYDFNDILTMDSNLSTRMNLKSDAETSSSNLVADSISERISCFQRENVSKKSSSKSFKRAHPVYRQKVHSAVPFSLILSSCTQCNFHTRSSVEYEVHCWTCHGRHVCSICGRSFAQKANRDRHMCLHTGARPYPCDMCGEKFSRGDKLKIHKNRSHGTNR